MQESSEVSPPEKASERQEEEGSKRQQNETRGENFMSEVLAICVQVALTIKNYNNNVFENQ